ncbi:hypothetical protein [Salinimicrobium marinum]|uniref:hypothetical protein n=1 Tax=Salinimicrobium marinum TaxID=680283 RepID=UPI001677EE05|nr:hypothetical protein [Salinimicrobium marinum]
MESTSDRIYIINTFKSSFGSTDRSIDRRLRNIRLVQIFNVSFLLLCFAGTFFSLVLPVLGVSSMLKWEDMPVLIIFSFIFLLHQFRALLYEAEILRHLKVLYNIKDSQVTSQLNKELLELIRKCNQNKPKNSVTVLILLFLLAGLAQMILENFILWDYLKLPYLLLSAYLLFKVYHNFIKLKQNISETENRLC